MFVSTFLGVLFSVVALTTLVAGDVSIFSKLSIINQLLLILVYKYLLRKLCELLSKENEKFSGTISHVRDY